MKHLLWDNGNTTIFHGGIEGGHGVSRIPGRTHSIVFMLLSSPGSRN